VSHTAAAIMGSNLKLLEAKRLHHRNLVAGHDALGIRHVLLIARRLAAIAIAAQVRQHHCEVPGQLRSNFVPTHVSLRIAVQQQQRRPASGHARVNCDLSGVNLALVKVRQQHRSCWDANSLEPVHSNLKLHGVDTGIGRGQAGIGDVLELNIGHESATIIIKELKSQRAMREEVNV